MFSRKILSGILVSLMLAGCSKGDKEARKYEMLQKNYGSPSELCAQARRVAQAYLEDSDEDGLATWNIKADLCEAQAAVLGHH